MKIKVFGALLVASAAISASPAQAAPFVLGTANGPGTEIFQFDLGTNTKTTILDTTTQNDGITVDPQGRILYTEEQPIGRVHRYDPVTNVDEILIGPAQQVFFELKDIILEPGGLTALVSDGGSSTGGHRIYRVALCAVPPCTITAMSPLLATNDGPHGLVYVGTRLFANIGDRISGLLDSRVAELDPLTLTPLANQSAVVSPNRALDGLTFDAITNKLYASSVQNDVIYSFDLTLSNPVQTLFSGQGLDAPDGLIAFSPNGIDAHLLVPSFSNNKLMDCIVTGVGAGTCSQRGADILGIDHLFLAAGPTTRGGPDPVPEPGSLLLLGTGLIAGVSRYRHRMAKKQ